MGTEHLFSLMTSNLAEFHAVIKNAKEWLKYFFSSLKKKWFLTKKKKLFFPGLVFKLLGGKFDSKLLCSIRNMEDFSRVTRHMADLLQSGIVLVPSPLLPAILSPEVYSPPLLSNSSLRNGPAELVSDLGCNKSSMN